MAKSSSTVPDESDALAGPSRSLKKNALGAPSIAFYIIAAASPLTGVVGLVPVMIAIGNGAGTPATFLIAGGILLLFAVGYLAMSRHVVNAGALYSYITLGLGRVVGLGSASLTVFAYSCIQFSLYGGFGYYLNGLLKNVTGVDIPWWLLALIAVVICLGVGLQGVHAGGIILGFMITLECLMLVLLGGGILVSPNTAAAGGISFEPFTFPALFAAGIGVSLMFAQTTFIGFEGSAIYSEEARNPKRSVPRATYFALIFMAVIYAGVSFLVINALGVADAQATALEQSGNLIFFVSEQALGVWASQAFQVLIVTAIFAAAVTFHNNLTRYLYAMGRQGLVWSKLANTRRVQKTPYVAGIVQSISAAVVILGFAIAGLDPYSTLFVWLAGAGTIAIIGAQATAAIAIFVFFRRNNVDKRLWHTVIAPILAIAGLLLLLTLALTSLDLLIGTVPGVTPTLIALIVLFIVAGVGYALWVRAKSPEKWEAMRVLLTSRDTDADATAKSE